LFYFAAMNTKRTSLLVVFLAVLASLSGYLMSKASFIGKLGMTYVYKEYRFLKTWWKGALAVFLVWMLLLVIQYIVERKLSKQKAVIVHVIFILLALVGLYFTYSDFQNTTSHRWLKERFHIGAYLFWLGWIIVTIFCMVLKGRDILTDKSITSE
jgi:cell division protein FtsW (lipid II flippase)